MASYNTASVRNRPPREMPLMPNTTNATTSWNFPTTRNKRAHTPEINDQKRQTTAFPKSFAAQNQAGNTTNAMAIPAKTQPPSTAIVLHIGSYNKFAVTARDPSLQSKPAEDASGYAYSGATTYITKYGAMVSSSAWPKASSAQAGQRAPQTGFRESRKNAGTSVPPLPSPGCSRTTRQRTCCATRKRSASTTPAKEKPKERSAFSHACMHKSVHWQNAWTASASMKEAVERCG
mmetsp:Transcript_21169/g.60098  ORF Transcript_21169/g.60098 Transcript_21169/m.60098 type:complete len:234 (-) Transcript_21169:377-1078(-)